MAQLSTIQIEVPLVTRVFDDDSNGTIRTPAPFHAIHRLKNLYGK
jgi:hypothetical protein